MDDDYVMPWSWIPHAIGADRQKEINEYLTRILDEMPVAKGPLYAANSTEGKK